jgi:hypothetical protein
MQLVLHFFKGIVFRKVARVDQHVAIWNRRALLVRVGYADYFDPPICSSLVLLLQRRRFMSVVE